MEIDNIANNYPLLPDDERLTEVFQLNIYNICIMYFHQTLIPIDYVYI